MTKESEKIKQVCDILLLTKNDVVEAVESSEALASTGYTKGTATFDMRRQKLLDWLKQGEEITGFEIESGGNDLTFSDKQGNIKVYYRFFGHEEGQNSARKWLSQQTKGGSGDLFVNDDSSHYGVFFDRNIAGDDFIVFELRDSYNKLIREYSYDGNEVIIPDHSSDEVTSKTQTKATFTDKQKQKKTE